jgi:hypothetical protein
VNTFLGGQAPTTSSVKSSDWILYLTIPRRDISKVYGVPDRLTRMAIDDPTTVSCRAGICIELDVVLRFWPLFLEEGDPTKVSLSHIRPDCSGTAGA